MKLKLLTFSILFLLGAAFPFFASEVSADESLKTCPGDYLSFIVGVRPESERKDAMSDMFRGYCQVNDLLTLMDELDAVRDELRTAAFDCQPTSAIKKDYIRILMEMHFVRHLKEGGVIREQDEDVLESLKEKKLEKLEESMKVLFADTEKMATRDDISTYFEVWKVKYDERIADYRQCEEGPFGQQVKAMWIDFTTTLEELDFSIEIDGGKSLKELIIPDTGDAKEEVTSFANSFKEAASYLFGEKEKRLDAVDPAISVSDLSAGGSIRIEDALSTLNTSFEDTDLLIASANRMARYRIIYGEGGSLQAYELQSLVRQLNSLLQTANTKDLPTIAVGAAKISDKQCN